MTVVDWTQESNHFDPEYAADPISIWRHLRPACPVARSEKFRGMWVPTRYEDIEASARDTGTFSSRSPVVAEFGAMSDFGLEVPPISSDPPYHTAFRRMLLPFFSPGRIKQLEPFVEQLADRLID